MNKADLKGLSKLSNSIVSKTVEIERLDLLYDMRDFLGIIANAHKPYDFFETLEISVKEAHEQVKKEFITRVYKLVVMPVPADFTIYIDNPMRSENKYVFLTGESGEIERTCRKIYYSNDSNPAIDEKVRIYVFGRWDSSIP